MKLGMIKTVVIILSSSFVIMTIPDVLWNMFKILPKEKPYKSVGRPIIPYRRMLDGILFILRTQGCQWKMNPK
jgi:hypothetical protein